MSLGIKLYLLKNGQSGKLLLAFTDTVILDSESRGAQKIILLCHKKPDFMLIIYHLTHSTRGNICTNTKQNSYGATNIEKDQHINQPHQ
jgi:hypothetical protein